MMSLIQKVQQNLGYPALQKIDLSTDKMVENDAEPSEDKFSQAAIPAILTGLYKYAQTDEGATEILHATEENDWIDKIFEGNKKEVIQVISSYSKQSADNPLVKMEAIADEAIMLINENIGEQADIKKIKIFLKEQKNDILLYLLPTLKMGDFLNDNSLDDDTNKMEGPISSLMHTLGNVFGSPITKEDLEAKEKNL